MITRELVVVGGGPAGMAAALAAGEAGIKDILLLERDRCLGGILNQCVHTGFGIEYFREILTGPEYAQRFMEKVRKTPGIQVSLRCFAADLKKNKVLTVISPGKIQRIRARALIMATGCRERTREMIHIPGDRPAGVFPAGLAQKLINIEGLLPGKEVVIVGSGDIGMIMARRLTLEGAKVREMVEIRDKTRGLVRNVVQCLEDFGIPISFRHRVARIYGKKRVEGADVIGVDSDHRDIPGTLRHLKCDTVLVSVGLIPENELIEMAGVEIDKTTNGPLSREINMTSIPGLFVCGNSFRVYDIVDNATVDAGLAGRMAAEYLAAGAA